MGFLPSSATLRAAATDALAFAGDVAWESSHRERMLAAVKDFAGRRDVDAGGLRAAFAPSRDVVPREATSPGVAVVSLVGVLTPTSSFFTMLGIGTSLQMFGQQVRAALADPSIKAIVVLVDSPGGLVGMVPETAALIRQARARKPVTAVVSGLSASAGFWISSNATRIEATPSALVGAIGVYTVRASIARQLEAEGVDVHVISAGAYKTEGLSALPMTDAERVATQARVDEVYGVFVGDVAAGRGVSSGTVRQGFGQGRVVSARQALALGMIDAISIVEDSIGRALSSAAGGRAMLALSGHSDENDADRARRFRLL